MRTLRLTFDFTYNPTIMHDDDPEAIEWFSGILSGDNLALIERGDIGDIIGRLTLVSSEETK